MDDTDAPMEVHLNGWTFVQIPIELIRDKELSHIAFRVFCAMAAYANAAKKCWPSQKTLAADLEISERHVRSAIRELMARGWVTLERRRRRKTAVYILNALPDRQNGGRVAQRTGSVDYTQDRNHSSGQDTEADETRQDRKRNAALDAQDRKRNSGQNGKTGTGVPPNNIQTLSENDNQILSENNSQQQRARVGLDVAAADLEKMTPKVQAGYWLRLAGVAGAPALELAQRLNPVDALAWALEAERWRVEGVAENPPGLLVTCARAGERPPPAQRAYAGWLLEDAGALTGLALAEIAGGPLRDVWARSRYVTGEYADYVER